MQIRAVEGFQGLLGKMIRQRDLHRSTSRDKLHSGVFIWGSVMAEIRCFLYVNNSTVYMTPDMTSYCLNNNDNSLFTMSN